MNRTPLSLLLAVTAAAVLVTIVLLSTKAPGSHALFVPNKDSFPIRFDAANPQTHFIDLDEELKENTEEKKKIGDLFLGAMTLETEAVANQEGGSSYYPDSISDSAPLDEGNSQEPAHSVRRREEFIETTDTVLSSWHTALLIHWAGEGSKVIFVIGRGTGSTSQDITWYRSRDYGHTFVDETSKLHAQSGLSTIEINSFVVSPHTAGHVVLIDRKDQTIFVTRDEGDTFDVYTLPFDMEDIIFNTEIAEYIIGQQHLHSVDGTPVVLIRVSKDDGETWSAPLTLHGTQCQAAREDVYWSKRDWSEADTDTTLYARCVVSETETYIVKADAALSSAETFVATDITPPHLSASQQTAITQFEVCYNYLLIKAQEDVSSNYHDLYVSDDRETFALSEFLLPLADYTIVDASENQIVISVDHANTSHVYISDEAGRSFETSLRDVVSITTSRGTIIDYVPMEGIAGIYVANKVYGPANVQTLISYDKGFEWERLTPPEGATNLETGEECELPACSLHLALDTAATLMNYQFLPTFTSESAPGMMLSIGTTGPRLTYATQSYVSWEAGLQWSQVSQLPKEFVSLDHGGVLVASTPFVRNSPYSSSILYSIDEGRSWEEYIFTEKPIRIVRMFTEPGEETLIVSFWGYRLDDSGRSPKWHVVSLDFESVLKTPCTDDDYTAWAPRDERSPIGCLLGERQEFERRKYDSICFNGINYDRPVDVTICPCYQDDYECDEGYEKYEDDEGTCLPKNNTAVVHPCQHPNQKITVSRGYRKVSGDKCQGGLESVFAPIEYICPDPCPLTQWTAWSHCDVCGSNVATRTRTLVHKGQPTDYCGCMEETKACELPIDDNSVSIYPSTLHVRAGVDVITLSALIDGIVVDCGDGRQVSAHVTFEWDLGGMVAISDGALYHDDDDGNSGGDSGGKDHIDLTKDVLDHIIAETSGAYTITVTVRNGDTTVRASAIVSVYRAKQTLHLEWSLSSTVNGAWWATYRDTVVDGITDALPSIDGIAKGQVTPVVSYYNGVISANTEVVLTDAGVDEHVFFNSILNDLLRGRYNSALRVSVLSPSISLNLRNGQSKYISTSVTTSAAASSSSPSTTQVPRSSTPQATTAQTSQPRSSAGKTTTAFAYIFGIIVVGGGLVLGVVVMRRRRGIRPPYRSRTGHRFTRLDQRRFEDDDDEEGGVSSTSTVRTQERSNPAVNVDQAASTGNRIDGEEDDAMITITSTLQQASDREVLSGVGGHNNDMDGIDLGSDDSEADEPDLFQ